MIRNNWDPYENRSSFGFARGNCGEPDWLVEGDFEGNFIKTYDEYFFPDDTWCISNKCLGAAESSYLYRD